MTPKTLVGLMVVLLLTSCFIQFDYVENCKASVLPKFYVDDDYDNSTPGWQVDHFDEIQDAINVSSAGDRIVVYAGTYNERITIPHKLDLFGEDRDITFIDGEDTGTVVTINAQNVNISHFTIRDSGNNRSNSMITINSGNAIITDNKITSGKNGITINNCDNNIIYDNIITSNTGEGISLIQSDSNEITYNTITSNSNGLFLYSSSYNNIENNSAIKTNDVNGIFLNETSNYNAIANNNISSNDKNGIFLNDHCDYNSIHDNGICSNDDSGIRLENSSSNTLRSNIVNSNSNYGIMVVGSSNTIRGCTINKNVEHGVFLFADDNNLVYSNIITGNTEDAIRLSNSTNDSIYTNEISSNSGYAVYLDYFTFDDLIYNNYFHDNTNNAMDKSLNHNYWNVAKTSGTNKVGGAYICGNYWDTFDETSEGVTDPDRDGISNTSYTIFASNKDYGPLLDVTPPTMGTPSATPSAQTIGSNTYISITITDNTEIKEVYLIVVYPNSQTSNFSILQNKTGNTYYCNKQFSPTGTFTYHIAAKDPRNWASSSSGNFYIDEGTAPTITDNSPTTGSPLTNFKVNATVTDDADSASELTVKVAWSHGSNSGNYTMVNVNNNFFEINLLLDNRTSNLTYKIYACDQWGNARTTERKTISVIDSTPPDITIKKHIYTSDGEITTYTIGATITDNVVVSEVTIEYWHGDNDHLTADMDKNDDNYYDKTIQLEEGVDELYCIIYATDSSGNQNDTTKPFINISGPYSGIIGFEITFDASNSFDLDGEITGYSWTFGDGTTGSGETAEHAYSTNGNYTITLTITDDNSNTATDTTYAIVIQSNSVETSSSTMNQIENTHDVTLIELFYAYDTDGDGIVDKFVDPNNKLTAVHTGNINISGNIVFLLSVDGGNIPEFMWNSTTNEIIAITHKIGNKDENYHYDFTDETVAVNVTVNKTEGWIYIEVANPSLGDNGVVDSVISVTKNGTEINSDRIISKGSIVYVLDDPDEIYVFTYSYNPPTLTNAEFSPALGSTINEEKPIITITYNVPVNVIDAAFYMFGETGLDIKDDLVTSDDMIFTYSPPNDLDDGYYELFIFVKQQDYLTNTVEDTAYYDYQSWGSEEESSSPISLIWFILGGILITLAVVLGLMKYKNITFESFVYIKNRKIIPFFKPIIFGPLRIDVNDEKVSKAEFYVNGKLKDTITQAPYIWNLDEPAFSKQKIETKVYDQNGNTSSSGEMTFFMFNPPRFFK